MSGDSRGDVVVGERFSASAEERFEAAISRARKGDRDSIGELWRLFNPRLVSFLRVLVPNDWEDTASETWIGISKSLPTFVGDIRSFESLLFTVARRRVIDYMRHQIAKPDPVSLVIDTSERLPGPEDIVIVLDSMEKTLEKLHQLPPAQAEVIALRIIGGLEIGEIAHIVEKTPGAVRVLSHRGLTTLAQLIKMPSEEEEIAL